MELEVGFSGTKRIDIVTDCISERECEEETINFKWAWTLMVLIMCHVPLGFLEVF